MVCTVATHPGVDWSEDEGSWSVLMDRIAEGNEHALTEFYDRSNRMVYRLAQRILRDSSSAEGVMLEVYLQVWRTAGVYDPSRGKVSSWLVSMTRSRAIDLLRSRKSRSFSLGQSLDQISDLQDAQSGPERLSIRASEAHIIQKLLVF
jgi:RNA polymerase sigma-70 factor (ECF subfamily)